MSDKKRIWVVHWAIDIRIEIYDDEQEANRVAALVDGEVEQVELAGGGDRKKLSAEAKSKTKR